MRILSRSKNVVGFGLLSLITNIEREKIWGKVGTLAYAGVLPINLINITCFQSKDFEF